MTGHRPVAQRASSSARRAACSTGSPPATYAQHARGGRPSCGDTCSPPWPATSHDRRRADADITADPALTIGQAHDLAPHAEDHLLAEVRRLTATNVHV